MSKKKVLVTGGAGFIGSHIVDELLTADYEVTVLDLKPLTEAINLEQSITNITYVCGDIRDEKLVDKLCGENEFVIHQAALVSVPISVANPLEFNSTNVTGTLNVLEAAARKGVKRVVFASSASVYGDTGSRKAKELDALKPESPYAIQKLVNEIYAKYYSNKSSLETIGLRYFNVYGQRQDPNSSYAGVLTLFRKCFEDGVVPTIFGDGEQTRDYVSVLDVAHANVLALSNGKNGEVYNIASGVATSVNQVVQYLSDHYESKLTPNYLPKRAGDVMHSMADTDKAKDELKFQAKFFLKKELSL